MNIKKRSIISFLLIIAMVFAMTALTACGGGADEEVEIRTISVKIVGADNNVLSELDVAIENVPSAITVYAAVYKAAQIEELSFVYDDDYDFIQEIGIYGSAEEAAATIPTSVDDEGTVTEIDDGSYWYWGWKVNGEEIIGSSAKEYKLNNGDKVLVEWLKAYREG